MGRWYRFKRWVWINLGWDIDGKFGAYIRDKDSE